MIAYSAQLRGDIRSLERTVLQWRVWAAAMGKWARWAGMLRRRRVARPFTPMAHEQHRAWRAGAGIRWSIAASGFAAELHDAGGGCLDGSIQVPRESGKAKRMGLSLSVSHSPVSSFQRSQLSW